MSENDLYILIVKFCEDSLPDVDWYRSYSNGLPAPIDDQYATIFISRFEPEDTITKSTTENKMNASKFGSFTIDFNAYNRDKDTKEYPSKIMSDLRSMLLLHNETQEHCLPFTPDRIGAIIPTNEVRQDKYQPRSTMRVEFLYHYIEEDLFSDSGIVEIVEGLERPCEI